MQALSSGSEITGSENLEVMANAVNYNAFLVDQIADAMKTCEGIVDYGSGLGTFAMSMRERGHSVICIEPEPNLKKRLTEVGLTTYASLDSLDDNSIDGIYSLNVLEHIEDDVAALESLYNKLVDGGALYIYVPAFQILYSAMDRRVGHVRRYPLQELTDKCRRAGFKIEQASYCDSLGFFASLAYKAMNPSSGAISRTSLVYYDRLIFPVSRLLDRIFGGVFGKNVWVSARKS